MSVPKVTKIVNEKEDLCFTLQGVDVCFANALRRTILSQIDRIALDNIVIEENTSAQFHNEIIKERLRGVPVHLTLSDKDMAEFCSAHVVEVDVSNQTGEKIYVTTEHFQVKNRNTGQYLSPTEVHNIFKPYQQFYFIDLMRLLPGKGETIQGERIKFKAQFGVHKSEENSCYSVVSKCAFHNTVDSVKAQEVWHHIEEKMKEDGATGELIALKRRDFHALDKFRYAVPHSFDFIVRSIGIHENADLVTKACRILVQRFTTLQEEIGKEGVSIISSSQVKYASLHPPSSMENALDVLLTPTNTAARMRTMVEDEEDQCHDLYSVGYILDHLLLEESYDKARFVGFAKFHPHNKEAVLRVALRTGTEGAEVMLKKMLTQACQKAQQVFRSLELVMGPNFGWSMA